ncbi:MAG: hypothetical protein LBC35_04300 [Coriobacteriales bacterium]|jgi:hypothetical protein|nr:hypothetical protein [Coriobacteriales bacterium]
MPYTVTSSERTTGLGNEGETKALLYLMSFAPNCEDVECFIVDFFNDVTGSDGQAQRLWDIQSKNKKSGPTEIGSELVTLFKNHVSEFKDYFVCRILFLREVTDSVRLDATKQIFSYADIKDAARAKVRKALKEACAKKSYIDNALATDRAIDEFLEDVLFVVSNGSKSDYIKPLVMVSSRLMPADRCLEGIFNEIRNLQSSKKNTNVEGVTISIPPQVFNHCRHLDRRSILSLVLNRVVCGDPYKLPTPQSFKNISDGFPPEEAHDRLENCKQRIALQMFDKNSAAEFWKLFEAISIPLLNHKSLSVDDIYSSVLPDTLTACTHLDVLATKYFIAIIKDGIQ